MIPRRWWFAPVLALWASASLWSLGLVVAQGEESWNVGMAQTSITPKKLFWMGGFAARLKPAEGTLDELAVKALSLEAADGGVVLLVTADLVGIPRWLYDRVCDDVGRRYGLDRSRVRLSASHTHSGPVLREALSDIYPLDATQRALIDEYSTWLEGAFLQTIDRAMTNRVAARLWSGEGRAAFAFNRRTNNENEWAEMQRTGRAPKGPSDFAVPVLALRSESGAWLAVVFGYAAHTSALISNYRWSADYSGVTQRVLETRYPGCQAMFFQGCGSDQSAVPRGTVDRCQALGEALASSVAAVLEKPMRPVASRLRSAFEFVALDFGAQPSREDLAKAAQGTDYRARWARRWLAELGAGKTFATGYPRYPVQVWRLGLDQLWVALGGEVCIDYALRLKREYGAASWVAGYSNDVMAYIPSRRLWEEGGYQAGAFDVYGLPADRWCPDIEERIASAVGRGVAATR